MALATRTANQSRDTRPPKGGFFRLWSLSRSHRFAACRPPTLRKYFGCRLLLALVSREILARIMTVNACAECGGQVSDKAEKCPSCGAPVKKVKHGCLRYALLGVAVSVGMVVLSIAAAAIMSALEDEESAVPTVETGSSAAAPAPAPAVAVPAPPAPAPVPAPPPEPPKTALELLAGPYAYSQENVDKRCEEEWTKRGELDRRMFNHCAQTEESAHGDLVALLEKHKDLEWTGSLLPAIWEQWTKRGLTQYQMVNHSMEQEIDAFLDLQYERDQPGLNEKKLARCFGQWSRHESPWTMTQHCYEQE